jgi:hypothetical protein
MSLTQKLSANPLGGFMGRLDCAALRTPNAGKLWMLPQHPDAHGLMPYEMAEIEECSNSLEQALRNGQEVNLAAQCAWYPMEAGAKA